MTSLLLLLLLAQRLYHVVPLPKVAASQQTHVETCGQVVYVRHQQDGDWHVTLAMGTTKVVLEIIPTLIPVAALELLDPPSTQSNNPVLIEPPNKGAWIRVRGIRRYDDDHNWPEIHPVEGWALAPKGCHVPR
jgi:hypothetical protein